MEPAVLVALIVALGGLTAGIVAGIIQLVLGWLNARAAAKADLVDEEQKVAERLAAEARQDLLDERAAAAAKAAADHTKALADAKAEIIGATQSGMVIIGKQLDGALSKHIDEVRKLARAEGKNEGILVGKLQGEQAERDRRSAAQK